MANKLTEGYKAHDQRDTHSIGAGNLLAYNELELPYEQFGKKCERNLVNINPKCSESTKNKI